MKTRSRAAVAALFAKAPEPPPLTVQPITHGESLDYNEGHRVKAREVFAKLPRYPGPTVKRSVQQLILDATGQGAELVDFMVRAARGEMTAPPGPEADEGAVVRLEPKDRLAAVKWLADRALGKAPETVQITVDRPAAVNWDLVPLEDRLTMERLLLKAASVSGEGGATVDVDGPESTH